MPRLTRIVVGIAAAAAIAASLPAAQASCATPFPIRTNSTVRSNPAWCGGYGCYADQGGPPVSGDVEAVFWALGVGNPLVGAGNDSGSLAQEAWFYPALPTGYWENGPYYYQVSFAADWGPSPAIDGCVTAANPRCTAILFSDQFDAKGYFALLSERADANGDFRFLQPGAAPFVLRETPRPIVTAASRVNPSTLLLTVIAPPVPADALYLDSNGCDDDVVVGYKIYRHAAGWGSTPPVDRRRENWEIPPGGAGPSGEPLPLQSPAVIEVDCTHEPFHLALSLVFDSGFELPHVSAQTGAIVCDPWCVDQDGDNWCEFNEPPEIPHDCDDSNPSVYPFAPEINDGLDNQCPGNAGHGLVDEISGRSGFLDPDARNEFSWPAQAGATLYELARSDRRDFSADCSSTVITGNTVEILDLPSPGAVLYLLSRALAPYPGSWGQTSAGAERLFSCP